MTRFRSRLAGFFLIAMALQEPADSVGQQAQRYQPARPTVSPYMNLLRPDAGPLPNYYSLVRPQFNQQAFNQQQLAVQAQQAASLNLLQTELRQNPTATPTGKGSGFMTSGRYFMRTPTGGQRNSP